MKKRILPDKVAKEYEDGATFDQLMKKYHVSTKALKYFLLDHGVKPHKRFGRST